MDVFRVYGGQPLEGEITISGSKNAALPIFAACLLTTEQITLTNIPNLSDIRYMVEILDYLGAKVEQPESGKWIVQAGEISHIAPYELVRKMRASVCLLGPLVGRLKKAEISIPGGCVIGPRPIDLHLKGLRKLNCKVSVSEGYVHVDASQITGSDVFLGGRNGSTVTGTANLIMASVLAPGKTRIESAACEPEIIDLCQMLIKMGAKIENIGGPELIITGVEKLSGCKHRVIPDRIEAGTFILAAAMTQGNVRLNGISYTYLGAFLDKLHESELHIEVTEDSITVFPHKGNLKPVDIITLPYPGFPTDLQAQMSSLMSITKGISIITEKIYPNRFMHVPELQRMGANIAIEGPSAIIKGPCKFSGAPVMASDLRASAALILAALAGQNETWVQRIYHLDRGYESFEQKLNSLGAKIERLSDKNLPVDLFEI